MRRQWLVILVLGWLVPCLGVRAADLSVNRVTMQPNGAAEIIVSGNIDGEETFGWSVLLVLVPRAGAQGTLRFTSVPVSTPLKRASFTIRRHPARFAAVHLDEVQRPITDVRQLGYAWPEAGSFTSFDTDRTGADSMNGAVDDNGTFVKTPVAFSGALAAFPIQASHNAEGVWDVSLSTSVGDSAWEGVDTILKNGTVSVSKSASSSAGSNDKGMRTDDIRGGEMRRGDSTDRAYGEVEPPRKSDRTHRD